MASVILNRVEPGFGEFPVPDELTGVVTRLWWLREPSPARFERILPMPAIHVIVNLSEPYRVVRSGSRLIDQSLEGPFISGIQSEHLLNENPVELWHVGAQLEPWAGRPFGWDPAKITGQVAPAEPMLPGITGLADELAREHSGPAATRLLADFLIGRLTCEPDPLAVRAVRALLSEPSLGIAVVAKRLGVTNNTLTSVVRRSIGTTPKRFAELVRHFRFLREFPASGPPPTWTELVARAGYYDQPHFIREFRRFTGMSPSAFLERLRASGAQHPLFLPFDTADDVSERS